MLIKVKTPRIYFQLKTISVIYLWDKQRGKGTCSGEYLEAGYKWGTVVGEGGRQ